jgi:glycosyltransferase involved in cell wall biosynthesis
MREDLNAKTKPIRVSFLIPTLAVGGAEVQLVRLANSLDRRRFSPSIICLFRGSGLEDIVASDVPVIKSDLALASSRSVPVRGLAGGRIVASLVRTLRRQRPHVLHAYLPVAYVLGAVAAWPLRVPVIVAGRRGLTSYETYGPARWLARFANQVIDMQICNSQAVRDWAIAKEHLPLARTRVIHNGIDLPARDPAARIPDEWRSNGVIAGMVANLIRYKGHREVLEAVSMVARTHPTFRLVLIGDGRERAALVELVRELGIAKNIVFAGTRDPADVHVHAFDFTILGSSEEGFPNAIMESMAHGVPVIATSVGGVTELVTDGVHGRLVPYGDPPAMAAAIIWMIDHPAERRRMGETARSRIAAEFSIARMVKATEAVYDEMLAPMLAGSAR